MDKVQKTSFNNQFPSSLTFSSYIYNFYNYLILPAALGPGVYLASNRNEYWRHKKKRFPESKARLVRGADNNLPLKYHGLFGSYLINIC
jgi:hypothetical protein